MGSKSKKYFADVACCKPSFADAVRSKPVLNKPVFLRLKYPLNHVSNFVENNSSFEHNPNKIGSSRPVVSSSSSNPQNTPPKRVLRWIPKKSEFNAEITKVVSARRESKISIFKKPSQAAHSGPAKNSPLISCSRCLALGHERKVCTNLVRCRACFNYGHTMSRCLSRIRGRWHYLEVSRCEGEGARDKHIYSGDAPILEPPVTPVPSQSTAPLKNPTSSMVNWACDPRPFVPAGFTLEDRITSPSSTPGSIHHRLLHPLQ